MMTVTTPGLHTGAAALKHLQSVSNSSSRADCCAEQNLSWHIHSEKRTAITIRILNFKKTGKKSKFILSEQQGPVSSQPLTSLLHLSKNSGKQVGRNVRNGTENQNMKRKLPFLSRVIAERKSEVLTQQCHRLGLFKKGRWGLCA